MAQKSAKKHFNLGSLDWTVTGYWPTAWTGKSMELGFAFASDIPSVPAQVPGSVQAALQKAGHLPDWATGLNSRACEWVEHREWMYSAKMPDEWFESGSSFILNCGGLDGSGAVIFNRKKLGEFNNAFIPYQFDLIEHLQETDNQLHLVFFLPPPWLGQIGYTSQMKDWKPRFNYGWDWIPRVVQIGPWEPVTLIVSDQVEIVSFRCGSDLDLRNQTGMLRLQGDTRFTGAEAGRICLSLLDGNTVLKTANVSSQEFAAGLEWPGLPVAAWWPNGEGDRKLYIARCELFDENGSCLDREERSIGFKNIAWRACTTAPEKADPWICVVNGRPVFLQGINWTPIRPTFADLQREDYAKLIRLYAELGCNIFRVWGGGFLEKNWFYDLSDELGILVWQEFPLSSSGHENWPHEDEPSMQTLVRIAESYIVRTQHRASLLMWCGGNELQGALSTAARSGWAVRSGWIIRS